MYIENSSKPSKFSEVLQLIHNVEEDYKWNTETYNKLTDIIEEDLKTREHEVVLLDDKSKAVVLGFEDDLELDDKTKKQIIAIFKEYADAVLVVLKDKNA